MNLPEPVSATLSAFVEAARAAFGDALRSVVLFGSAAEGKLRKTSDVNLLLVLGAIERPQLDAIREPLRVARAAIGLQPMFVLESELPAAAEAFANKFEDIRRRHVVLHGADVISGLAVSREALLRRVRQVLLNQTLRLRDTYAEQSLREEQAARAVADAAGPLRAAAASILELEGRAAADPKSALETLASEEGFAELLPRISEARERGMLPPGAAAETLFEVARLARRLYERAARS
ncbi:MAG TPA: nucleotidyltransferase domain-containing protein [Thermoanaerobaculia bacterium]